MTMMMMLLPNTEDGWLTFNKLVNYLVIKRLNLLISHSGYDCVLSFFLRFFSSSQFCGGGNMICVIDINHFTITATNCIYLIFSDSVILYDKYNY